MASNIFLPGDLVISVYGAGAPGDGTTYTDNQATPITLEDVSATTGAVNGTLVLPQTATVTNGVTENVISGEYGSSSEGSLELSQNGQNLVIAGYGVNAATYNGAEAGVTGSKGAGGTYGNNALAQTYSVPTGGTNGAPAGVTVVPRVIADITNNGATDSVDTSTSLINVDNENNPRSVATINGSNLYVSGQGVKGDATQGVFVTADGANNAAPTPINTATDTRTAELYNNTLYVSADSSINKGTGNISSYGTSPTGQTTATPLPGITGTLTLTAAQANTVNAGSVGSKVDISPENFFFANATTLYVADSGNPKGGTVGDGGLQKWTLTNGTWTLNYTLSAGLNLVPNTTADPGSGGKASTGLIGLTGTVNTNGTVSLYATNATVGDLNQTSLYGITDTLSATTLPTNESFSTLATAAPDTNIRGVAFAPSVVCFCSGTRIRVARGGRIEDVAVERLAVGDLVVTASGAHRPIRWLGHRAIDCRHHPRPHEAMPVRVSAHAFGPDKPARDLRVSPGHAICVDVVGEVLIPASALTNSTTIQRIEVEEVTYWHVELDRHDILLAENLACESYLEMGNRGFFAADVERDARHTAPPDAPVRSHADFCRPFHDGGPLVEVVRSQLRARAASLGWTLDRSDPFAGLHLLVDGNRVEPVTRGLAARFAVPARARGVWLVSATSCPWEVYGGADDRDLGVCVNLLMMDDGFAPPRAIDLADPLLSIGFHGLEDGARRWTAGRASLPAALWAEHEGAADGFFLRVELAGPAVPRWVAPHDVSGLAPALPAPFHLALVAGA